NRQLNLTRITDPVEFWEKHLWDSLRGIASLWQSHAPQRVIDIGTGGGFPGIPVAIATSAHSENANATWTVTLLDSTRKKIAFLKAVLSALDLQNATTLVDRAEQVGQHPAHREAYDIALVRAVGPASVCAEYALPLLKIGGLAILYRGQWTASETEVLQRAGEKLGGKVESIAEFFTPISQSIRHCLYLQKVASTPKEYPRSVGVPAQQPL
ncbi:MAG TPA: 16S rRNA (guanine(527)-N(7))-methyltransferase RsmG, partial [Candidatus Caenarcaniphilales bacterium]